jgi:hypothetical protein
VPEELLRRLDAYTAQVQAAQPYLRLSRADVLHMLLGKGLHAASWRAAELPLTGRGALRTLAFIEAALDMDNARRGVGITRSGENMEPRLTRLLSSCGEAHSQLTKALAQPKDEFVRDAAIQRFEFTVELDANSPRASLREAFRLRLMDDDSRYMAMLQSRNLASHTYEETVAETIYASLPTFADAMHAVVAKIQVDLEGVEEHP